MAAMFAWGSASVIGLRKTNEDVHVIANLRDYTEPEATTAQEDILYCGLFDGHGGNLASSFCGELMHEHLVRAAGYPRAMDTALVEAYERTNRHFTRDNYLCFSCGGCTALTLVATTETIYVANAGDCRAVARLSDGRSVQITRDHKPGVPDECSRIERCDSCVVSTSGVDRLAGVLSVSRGIGDMDFQAKGFSCVPDVFTLNAADVDVIVMACDGLWDVLELRVLERVMAMIQQATLEMVGGSNTTGSDGLDAYKILDKVAHTLCQYAVQVGSTDNVSVIIGARRELFPPEVLAKTPLATTRFSIQM